MHSISQHSLMPYKLYYLICASLLFISILELPPEYFTVLRYIITLGAFTGIIRVYQLKSNTLWYLAFGAIVILYNPFFPIQLNTPADWIPFHIITAIIFVARVVVMCSIRTTND